MQRQPFTTNHSDQHPAGFWAAATLKGQPNTSFSPIAPSIARLVFHASATGIQQHELPYWCCVSLLLFFGNAELALPAGSTAGAVIVTASGDAGLGRELAEVLCGWALRRLQRQRPSATMGWNGQKKNWSQQYRIIKHAPPKYSFSAILVELVFCFLLCLSFCFPVCVCEKDLCKYLIWEKSAWPCIQTTILVWCLN